MIWDIFEDTRSDLTFHTYRELVARNHSFEALAVKEAQDPWQPTMTGAAAHPERFAGQSVSGSYFRVLGVQPHWEGISKRLTTGSKAPMW